MLNIRNILIKFLNLVYFFIFLIIIILFIYTINIIYKYNIIFFYLIYLFCIITLIFIFFQSYKLTYNAVISLFILIFFILLCIFFFYGLYAYLYNKLWIINLGKFICLSGYYTIQFIFILDYISIFFSFLISFITFIVFFFIKNYFKLESEINKFTLLIGAFSISMILLVISTNLLFFFFWWEMIGLTSFFLINFYYIKKNVFKSSLKAFYFNKISDNFILIGSILLMQDSISLLHIIPGTLKLHNIDFTSLFFLFMGASVKSSQFGFHFWLPDSMEAPVPASALIHSATLVSAGIYILMRLNNYIIFFNYFYNFIYIWYSITALYGGLVASFQIDIKKLLAYSTISHCGFLFITTLNGIIMHVFIYLLLHGVFKAISFILAGRIIQQIESQDLRCMSQLLSLLPLEAIILLFSLINLSALPATLGLYYKVLLLTSLLNSNISYFILILNFLGCLTGIAYTLHIFKAFNTKHLKYKKNFFSKINIIPSLFVCILSLFIFIFIFIIYIYFYFYFTDILYIDFIKNNNKYIFKLFYSIFFIYIFININLDVYKNKNYIYCYYLFMIIFILLINWVGIIDL